MLAPSVATCVRARRRPAAGFHPGQFLQVHFHYADGTATKRSYSLATIHDHALGPGEAVEIAVSYVAGARRPRCSRPREGGTSTPAALRPLLPDAGDANQRYLLIGTGTGVTPYRAMLPQLEQLIAERGIEVVLLFGARTPANCCTATSSARSPTRTRNFRFVPCFRASCRRSRTPTCATATCSSSSPNSRPDARTDIAYLCGNPTWSTPASSA
jgi:ferredoxin-NADP reductase